MGNAPRIETKRDYYETLGVDRSATRDQLKQAYRQLALKSHPKTVGRHDGPVSPLCLRSARPQNDATE